MFTSSIGGGVAARCPVYRHALARFLIALLGPGVQYPAGFGWSQLSLTLCALLMQWSPAPTLAQRFESALSVLDQALPRRRRTGRTYQGFIKASLRRSSLSAITTQLRTLTEETAGSSWRVGRFVPIGVDGSKFDAPRTLANEELGLAGKDKCGPQMMMLLLTHLGCVLPWDFRVGKVIESERALLRSTLDDLPPSTLLIADAGFTGFSLLSELHRRGIHFLVRVGRGIQLLRELGYYKREGKSTVYLWPTNAGDHPPLVLRLLRFGKVYLITSVTNPKELSRAAASDLYRRRWGLEVSFRTLKQTLERRKVRSCAPKQARAELAWSVIALWVLALLGARALSRAGLPLRRMSIAKALASVRHAIHTRCSERALSHRLRKAVLDPYQRKGTKKAYRWPHKKNPPPPGPPFVTTATRTQVARAKSLRATFTAG